jgi:hypothetical protein
MLKALVYCCRRTFGLGGGVVLVLIAFASLIRSCGARAELSLGLNPHKDNHPEQSSTPAMNLNYYYYDDLNRWYCDYNGEWYYCGVLNYQPNCCAGTCCVFGYDSCNALGECIYGSGNYYYGISEVRYCSGVSCGLLDYHPNCCGSNCCPFGYDYCGPNNECLENEYFEPIDDDNFNQWYCDNAYCVRQGGYETPNGCCGKTCCYYNDYCCINDYCTSCNTDDTNSTKDIAGIVVGALFAGCACCSVFIGWLTYKCRTRPDYDIVGPRATAAPGAIVVAKADIISPRTTDICLELESIVPVLADQTGCFIETGSEVPTAIPYGPDVVSRTTTTEQQTI